jgi:hypothetical protein
MTDNHREDPTLFDAIEEFVMNSENIGIDPQIFHILDNTESSEEEIAGIEKMIEVKLALRLRNMSCSIYYGMHRYGTVEKFNDVIMTIGMQPAKLFIIALTQFSRLGAAHKMIEVESFAVSLFAKIIAEQMHMNQDTIEKAELAGLFLTLGRVVIAIYETEKNVTIDPAFIEKHHRIFAVKLIEKLTLPAYLADVVLENRFVLRKNSFPVTGIVYLAQSLVEKLIRETGLIELKSPMPVLVDNLETTIGLKIQEYFNLIGLGKYLRVIRC